MAIDKSIDLKQSSNNIKSINIYISIILQPVRKRKNMDQFMSQRKKIWIF